ncbi:MAG: Mov34/MPN/PAD-1 family protein [Bacteroidota bacterium]
MTVALGEINLKISEEVLLKISEYVQNDDIKPESGGMLIGYYLQNGDFSITDITVPGKGDRQSRYRFIRSAKRALNLLTFHFNNSKGKKIYLGEWHTHPENNPTPSSIDNSSILERIRRDKINSDTIFTIICGIERIYIQRVKKSGLKEYVYVSLEDIAK